MAAILDEMRRLDAARRSGTISESDFLDARSELMARVDDVEFQHDSPPPAPRPVIRQSKPRLGNSDVFNIAVFVVVGATVLTALSAWLLNDLTLALTLSATVVAALTVRAVQKLDD